MRPNRRNRVPSNPMAHTSLRFVSWIRWHVLLTNQRETEMET